MPINLNAVENIPYQKSFVAFLDILGFKNLVFSKKAADHKKLNQYFGIVNSAIEYLKSIQSKEPIGSIIISDSIILSMPHDAGSGDKLDNFRNLCIAVGLIQQNLAKKNIWLRGAISSGNTYFNSDKRQIVGPAYANAYKLEEDFAQNPRVIIDSKIIKLLGFSTAGELINEVNKKSTGGLDYSNWNGNILFYWSQEIDNPGNYIIQDLPLFIDYLSPNVEMRKNDLDLIIKNIKGNIYTDVAIYGKYRWVVDYLKSIYICPEKDLIGYGKIEEILRNL